MCILTYPIIWTVFSKLNSGKWCSTQLLLLFLRWVWHSCVPRNNTDDATKSFWVVSGWEWPHSLVKFFSLILLVTIRRTGLNVQAKPVPKIGLQIWSTFYFSHNLSVGFSMKSFLNCTCRFCFCFLNFNILIIWRFCQTLLNLF